MKSPINIRFMHKTENWRVMCHPSSGRCDIWRNGSFIRSATYIPRQGLQDHDGLMPDVVPALLDKLFEHDSAIETVQSIERV